MRLTLALLFALSCSGAVVTITEDEVRAKTEVEGIPIEVTINADGEMCYSVLTFSKCIEVDE